MTVLKHDLESTSNAPRHRLLAVDDDPLVLNGLKRALHRQQFDIVTAYSGAEGLEYLATCAHGEQPAAIMADYMMPNMNGVQFLEKVKERWPHIQRILLTAVADRFVLEEAINRSEIHRVLNKPWDRSHLITTLRSACEQSELIAENERLMVEMTDARNRLEELAQHLENLVSERTAQLTYAKRAWETTFDAIGEPVILINDSYAILRANHALAEHSGYTVTQLPGKLCHKLLADSDRICEGCPLDEVRRTGEAAHSTISLAPRDNIFSASAFPFGGEIASSIDNEMAARYVCVYRDITAQDRLHRKLLMNEKMTALGVLSGAVAHEINNPLGGILAFAQIMMREIPETDEKHQFLQHIEDSAIRCQKTVRNLLDFARFSPREERQRTSMGEIIEKAVSLVRHRLNLNSQNVEVLERNAGALNAPVVLNSNQVQMVFVNLLHNASDAMDAPGTIQLKVNLRSSTSPHQVITRVIDSGSGIAKHHLSKIFDPFFTTKIEGKGTGLGLALSHQIVEENSGKIEVFSKVDVGTTFTISFPVAE